MNLPEHEYIYDWNELRKVAPLSRKKFELFDETLRDGLQSPSVTDPSIEKKIELLELMESLGISSADIGLPGAGPRAKADVLAMTKAIAQKKLKLKPAAAARTKVQDIAPIADTRLKNNKALFSPKFQHTFFCCSYKLCLCV